VHRAPIADAPPDSPLERVRRKSLIYCVVKTPEKGFSLLSIVNPLASPAAYPGDFSGSVGIARRSTREYFDLHGVVGKSGDYPEDGDTILNSRRFR